MVTRQQGPQTPSIRTCSPAGIPWHRARDEGGRSRHAHLTPRHGYRSRWCAGGRWRQQAPRLWEASFLPPCPSRLHGSKPMASSSSPQWTSSDVTPVRSHHQSSVTTISTAKVFDLSSVFNERARPRGEGVRFLQNFGQSPPASPPAATPTTPDYTHVANLYPSLNSPQAREDSPSPYRYSPVTVHSSTVTMPSPQQQSPALPVEPQTVASLGPLSVDVRDSPTLSTTSVSSSRTDPEAEVDALTSLLLQGLDTVSRGKRSRNTNTVSAPVPVVTASSTPSPTAAIVSTSNTSQTSDNLLSKAQVRSQAQNILVGPPEEAGAASGIRVTSRDRDHDCFRCRRTIPPGEHVHLSALRTRFHVNCFACYSCGISLAPAVNPAGSGSCPPAAYFHAGDRLLCDRCVIATVESCHACGRSIAERLLRALGRAYHPNCFVCTVCAKGLDGQAFTVDVHGRLHCLEDFHNRYAPRCHGCGEPIAPSPGENEARRVVSGGHSFHVTCHPRK